MAFIPRSKTLSWTHHAHAKMAFYKLSEGRVRRVLHSPKRIEEGVAPKTVAMMQPGNVRFSKTPAMSSSSIGKRQEVWAQEIWVMIQDGKQGRTVISAWRYPGMTKPRSAAALTAMREQYDSFMESKKEKAV